MRNFEEIPAKNKGIVKTLDLTVCRLIGKGGDGSVYQLTPERCVKIFVNEETQKRELKALKVGQASTIIPRIYEYGINYIVMEFVKGYSLKYYLKKEKRLPESIVKKILFMLDEMQIVGFTRKDTEVRHILFNEQGEIKVIDHKRALTTYRSCPSKLLSGLQKIGFLEEFLGHVNKLRPSLYKEWTKHY